MTPEEKAAVMQFMGTTYGQAHQQDKMLVGGSSNLQPKSQELKKVFEQTAHMPTVSKQPQQQPQQPQQQQPQQPQHSTSTSTCSSNSLNKSGSLDFSSSRAST